MKHIIIVLILLLFASGATAEDTLSIGNVTIEEGKSVIVNILISNSSCDYGFFAMQWDNQVINFTEVDCGVYGCAVTVNSCDTTEFRVEDGRGGNDTCAVSVITTTYMGSDADDADNYVFGCARITAIGDAGDVTDLNIFDSYIISDGGAYMPCRYIDGSVAITPLMGDVNKDRIVDVRDAISLLNHVSDPTGSPIDDDYVADMNQDGMIDILDVVLVINRCVATA